MNVKQGDMTVRYLQHGGWAFRHAQHLWKQAGHKQDFQVTAHFWERRTGKKKINLDPNMWYENEYLKHHHGILFWTHLSPRSLCKESTELHGFITLAIECVFNPSRRPYSTECIWIVNETPVRHTVKEKNSLHWNTQPWWDTHSYQLPPLSEIQFYAMPCSIKPFHMCIIQN